jgi:CHAD domain-containing protein
MNMPSAGAAVHRYLSKQVKALRKRRKRAVRREEDAVHKMRVATRRLRSLLRTYEHLYAEVPLSRKRLKWLADALGEVRDLEVLRMRFAARLNGEEPEWFLHLVEQERLAYGRLEKAFARQRFAKLMSAAETMAATPHFSSAAVKPASEVLAADVAAARTELVAALDATLDPKDPDAARHEARKAAKRTRYTAEAAAKALGAPAEAVAVGAEKLQELLGKYQDDVVALAYLEAHAPDAPIIEAERRKHDEDRAEVEAALAELR